MHDNALEGALPERLFELKQLTYLDLQHNKITGPIPDAVSELEFLTYLNLNNNKLNGSIPNRMDCLYRLSTLDLSHNHLSGSIPKSMFAGMKMMQLYLNFSYNFLDGHIPDELGMLEMVQAIDISNNNISGVIPTTLRGCRNLFSLDLSGNKLSGFISADAFAQSDMLRSLNLSRNKLDGEIPENLAKLKHLSSLDLSQNQLRGHIPESFTNSSSLRHLNLSFNQLEGHVPEKGIFKTINMSSLVGNRDLCGNTFLGSCSKRSSNRFSKKAITILSILGSVSVVLTLVLAISFLLWHAKESNPVKLENPETEFTAAVLRRFDKEELENATSSFSKDNIIGASSLSTVYKGQLEDGQLIAVKKLNLHQFSKESDKSFYREVKNLSHLRHKNLVKVLGYAWESEKLKAVILQYMENGSLESVIHGSMMDLHIWTLSKRIDLCISVASALDYLHSGYDFPIVHCDLKPSNILLDGDWVAHVSDFGTARMLDVHLHDGSSLSSTSAFEGTIGYLAPEFAYMRNVTTKVDVFSFGIVVMEFLTKQRPTGLMEEDGQPVSLRQRVEKSLATGTKGVLQVLDPMLASNDSNKQMEAVEELFKLALFCTSPNPEERPNMNEVLSILSKLKANNYENEAIIS